MVLQQITVLFFLILLAVSPVLAIIVTLYNSTIFCRVIFSGKELPITSRFYKFWQGYTFIAGPLLVIVLWYIAGFPAWEEAILISASFTDFHEPVRSQYQPVIALCYLLGSASYLLLLTRRHPMPPLQFTFMIIGSMTGLAVSVLFLIQLIAHLNNILVLFFMLYPFNYIICSLTALTVSSREYIEIRQNKTAASATPMSRLDDFLFRCLYFPHRRMLLLLPLLPVLIIISTVFGQHPDAFLQAFLQTSDWTLSRELSPPAVEWDSHYLCTAALCGHKNIVKPLRYGIRRNEKIIVNRQLQAANAFEQLLEDYTPRFHKKVRAFYDRWGFPVSRYITKPLAADLTWLLMKPLEFLFIFIIYMADCEPETRIQGQYLPKHYKKYGGAL